LAGSDSSPKPIKALGLESKIGTSRPSALIAPPVFYHPLKAYGKSLSYAPPHNTPPPLGTVHPDGAPRKDIVDTNYGTKDLSRRGNLPGLSAWIVPKSSSWLTSPSHRLSHPAPLLQAKFCPLSALLPRLLLPSSDGSPSFFFPFPCYIFWCKDNRPPETQY